MWTGLKRLGEEISVLLDDLARPFDLVFDSLTRWVRTRPQLKVLKAVVVTHAVDVVNGFGGEKLPSEALFHDEPMLHHVAAAPDEPTNVSVWFDLGRSTLGSGSGCPDWGQEGLISTLSKLLVVAPTPSLGEVGSLTFVEGTGATFSGEVVVVMSTKTARNVCRFAPLNSARGRWFAIDEGRSGAWVATFQPTPVVHVAHPPRSDTATTPINSASLVHVDGV